MFLCVFLLYFKLFKWCVIFVIFKLVLREFLKKKLNFFKYDKMMLSVWVILDLLLYIS